MFVLATLVLFCSTATSVVSHSFNGEATPVVRALPKRWYHEDDHPVNSLFKRGGGTDGIDYAEVGSPTWSAAFPTFTPDSSQLPQEWVDALNTAVAAGSIPNIPPTTNPSGSNPIYASGFSATEASVCSGYSKCRAPGDIWDAPPGYFGTGFDDGPYEGSALLYPFLQQNQISSTHFMIGVYILENPALFLQAFETLQCDIAVHTYTHPYMTTLSNLDLVAQFGWAMEIIHNSTGGRVPRYWRPPYGDADNRVRAIAKEVFGLTTIFWNHDTEDWSLTSGGTTAQIINSSFTQWLAGDKSTGLIVLEHELSNQSTTAFMDAYPNIISNGWTMQSVTEVADNITSNGDVGVYGNSDSDTDTVTPMDILAGSSSSSSSTSTASSSSGTSTSAPSMSSSRTAAQSSGTSASDTSSSNSNSAGILGVSEYWISSGILLILGTLLT